MNKSTILLALVVLSLLAVAGIRAKNIGGTLIRELPDITSASIPVRQWYTLDGQGEASFGYAYPGQAASSVRDADGNMAGSWSYIDADGNLIRATYTAGREQGFLVSSTNQGPAAAAGVAPNVQSDSKINDAAGAPSSTPKVGACNNNDSGLKTRKAVRTSQFRDSHQEKKEWTSFVVGLAKSREGDDPKFYSHCTGSLISPTHVLTSARCVTEDNSNKLVNAGRFNVRLGISKQSDDNLEYSEQASSVHKISIHPGYDHIMDENDIAVLTLDLAVEITAKVAPVCLVPKCFNSDGSDVIAMGWGYTKWDGKLSEVLRFAFLTGMKNDQCSSYFKNEKLPSTAMCAIPAGEGGTCQNDNGGPLVVENLEDAECRLKLVGIVSFGNRCVEGARNVGVYTKVASFLPWIAQQTAADAY